MQPFCRPDKTGGLSWLDQISYQGHHIMVIMILNDSLFNMFKDSFHFYHQSKSIRTGSLQSWPPKFSVFHSFWLSTAQHLSLHCILLKKKTLKHYMWPSLEPFFILLTFFACFFLNWKFKYIYNAYHGPSIIISFHQCMGDTCFLATWAFWAFCHPF